MRLAILLTALLVAPAALALPTPGLNGEATLATLGRVFPEALETNDYVSYDEARAGLEMLAGMAPDTLELVELGDSTGWADPVTGERETTKLWSVEVTNEKSPVDASDKLTLVFFLSIHANEKGGREGGLRVIEDFARGVGLAAEEKDLVPMLDYQKLVFIFANSDGWTHDEARYRLSGSPRTDWYTRENAHELDLNRQFPTVGYLFEDYTPLSESESQAMVNYTRTLTNVVAGADIHGMLQNTNLVRMLLKDGEKSQQQLFENERLAELYKERLNGNPHYAAWSTAPDAPGVCCGQVAEWAATFDAIGYSASGTAGAWIVQRQGMRAPGYTVELAYNHIVADAYYPGAGAWLNDLHVEAVRDNVVAFMRFASQKVNLAVETHGQRIGVLTTPVVATNADDDASQYAGWFTQTDADDAYDVAHRPFNATANAYWRDLQAFVRSGDKPGVLDLFDAPGALAAKLDAYDVVVVPGSASDRAWAPAELAALKAWVQKGGRLVLTDSALRMLVPLGLVAEGDVDSKLAYSGYTDLVDRGHALAKDLKGFPRQTYDPNPLGFAPDSSIVWLVDRAAFEKAGGATVGAVGKKGTGEATVEDPAACDRQAVEPPLWREKHAGDVHGLVPTLHAPVLVAAAPASAFEKGVDCQELDATNVGLAPLGAGEVLVFGAILPDPTEEANHPYGLDGHAVAASGNKILLGMLGAEFVYATPPAVEELGFARVLRGETAGAAAGPAPEEARGVPAAPLALLLVALALPALLRRR